jgi:hypothetical protein
VTVAPIHIVDANIINGKTIPPDGRIEIAFDRLLLPASITRQTFVLSDKRGDFFTPIVSYDPVARVVTVTPNAMLENNQFYELRVATPQSPSDLNGIRAIDGATLDPMAQAAITFQVVVGGDAGASITPPVVDFCRDISRLFDKCAGAGCHTDKASALGLRLDNPADIAMTAVGRVAAESNTGPRAMAQPAGLVFGVDMPILDPGAGSPTSGDPANSLLVYKLLMAVPLPKSTTVQPMLCDGGPAPPAMGPFHTVMWQPLSDAERATLAGLIPGREMPFPGSPNAPLNQADNTLTLDELELVSNWIGQPRAAGVPLVPQACGCIP